MSNSRTLAVGASIAAQAVWSGGNFLLNVVMIRWLDARSYGVFVGASTLVYFISGYLVAARVTPQTLAEGRTDASLASRYAAIARGLFSMRELWLPVVVAGIGVFLMTAQTRVAAADRWSASWVGAVLAAAVVFAAVSLAAREAAVRYAYVGGLHAHLLWSNATAVVTGGLLLLAATSFTQSVGAGVVVFSVAAYIAYKVLALGLRLPNGKDASVEAGTPEQRAFIRSVSRNGIVAHLVTSLRTHGYVYLVPLAGGLAAVAQLNASRLSIAVSTALMPVIMQLSTAYLLKRRSRGLAPTLPLRYCFFAALAMVVTGAATLAFLYLVFPQTTDKFGDGARLSAWWLVYAATTGARALLETEILLNHAHVQGKSNTIGCIVAVALLFPLTIAFGVSGALIALVCSELVVLLWYLQAHRRATRPAGEMRP